MRGYDVTPVNPYPQPSNLMLPQSTYSTPTVTMSSPMYPPSYTSMTSRGPNPANMASYPPRPSAGMSGSPPPSFSHGAPPPPGMPIAAARQNSLPSAPGLPQRPAFDSPNVSKEDMAKMHGGPGSTPPGLPMQYNGQMSAGSYAPGPPPNGMSYPQYGNSAAPYPGYPTNLPTAPQASDYVIDAQGQSMPQQSQSIPTEDDIDALIRSVTGEQPQSRPAVDSLPIGQSELQGKMADTAGSDTEVKFPRHGSVSTNEPFQTTMTQKQMQMQSQFGATGSKTGMEGATSSTRQENVGTPGLMSSSQSHHLDVQGAPPAQNSDLSLAPGGLAEVETDVAESGDAKNLSTTSKKGIDVELQKQHVPTRNSLSSAEITQKPHVSSKKKTTASSGKASKLIYTDTTLAPEERRARRFNSSKNQQSSKNRKTETVLDQPGEDGQEVTGPVDDSLES